MPLFSQKNDVLEKKTELNFRIVVVLTNYRMDIEEHEVKLFSLKRVYSTFNSSIRYITKFFF